MTLENFKALLYDPPLVLLGRVWTKLTRGVIAQERWGVLDRPSYAYGILRAGQVAKYFGHKTVTVCEFGVAHGDGLLNMIYLAEKIGKALDMRFRVVGFDTGAGLPLLNGYKDHPEVWSSGDFMLADTDKLRARIGSRAELVLGDISDNIADFLKTLTPDSPLGFISVDVDLYTAAAASLLSLTGEPDLYLPAVSTYLDDVAFYFSNRWCGELAAISDFNAAHELRKIDIDRTLPGKRPVKYARWYPQMYVCHVLDHPKRQVSPQRDGLNMGHHREFLTKYGIL
ncbi:MAG TPA: hypothetical protein VL361_27510 [Candidatus Limnocylindrales bacterium]|nr:hypothetical protein [Candidatus Limnocylindrales bacterium]